MKMDNQKEINVNLVGTVMAKKIFQLMILPGKSHENMQVTSTGATHYHATYVRPYWAPTLDRITRIGSHIFYRMKGG